MDSVQLVPEDSLDQPLGNFQVLPREQLHGLFNHIPAPELAKLALLSKALGAEVRDYILQSVAQRRFRDEIAKFISDPEKAMNPFRGRGLLLRVSTVTMNTADRAAFVCFFLSENSGVTSWCDWDCLFKRIYEKWTCGFLDGPMQITGLSEQLEQVLTSAAGEFPSVEMEVRSRFRAFFLDQIERGKKDCTFWLSTILRTQETVVRLFNVMYGPLQMDKHHEYINWRQIKNAIIDDHSQCKAIIAQISHTLSRLVTEWAKQEVLNLLE